MEVEKIFHQAPHIQVHQHLHLPSLPCFFQQQITWLSSLNLIYSGVSWVFSYSALRVLFPLLYLCLFPLLASSSQ